MDLFIPKLFAVSAERQKGNVYVLMCVFTEYENGLFERISDISAPGVQLICKWNSCLN